MLYVSFMIPVLILLLGFVMYKYPPKKINWFVGYRTSKSMMNKEMWDIAHEYCGKVWMLTGVILVVLSFGLYLLEMLEVISFTENILTVIILGQVGVILLSVLIVENKLKKYKGE